MPRYYGPEVQVNLKVCDVKASTTSEPTINAGTLLNSRLDKAKQGLASGTRLSEEALAFRGEYGPSHLIGRQYRAPFFLTAVGAPRKERSQESRFLQTLEATRAKLPVPSASSQASSSALSTLELTPEPPTAALDADVTDAAQTGDTPRPQEPAIPPTTQPPTPQTQIEHKALSVLVGVTRKTFHRHSNRGTESLKIEAFFNGEFAGDTFVQNKNLQQGQVLTVELAGKRIARLAEKAWLLERRPHPGNSATEIAQDPDVAANTRRWNEVNRALHAEAAKRPYNKDNIRSPSGDFLTSLASYAVPESVANIQSSSTQSFGILDVVISIGEGRKLSTAYGYLKSPQTLKDPEYQFALRPRALSPVSGFAPLPVPQPSDGYVYPSQRYGAVNGGDPVPGQYASGQDAWLAGRTADADMYLQTHPALTSAEQIHDMAAKVQASFVKETIQTLTTTTNSHHFPAPVADRGLPGMDLLRNMGGGSRPLPPPQPTPIPPAHKETRTSSIQVLSIGFGPRGHQAPFLRRQLSQPYELKPTTHLHPPATPGAYYSSNLSPERSMARATVSAYHIRRGAGLRPASGPGRVDIERRRDLDDTEPPPPPGAGLIDFGNPLPKKKNVKGSATQTPQPRTTRSQGLPSTDPSPPVTLKPASLSAQQPTTITSIEGGAASNRKGKRKSTAIPQAQQPPSKRKRKTATPAPATTAANTRANGPPSTPTWDLPIHPGSTPQIPGSDFSPALMALPSRPAATVKKPKRSRHSQSAATSTPASAYPFRTPDLSRGCVMTYADASNSPSSAPVPAAATNAATKDRSVDPDETEDEEEDEDEVGVASTPAPAQVNKASAPPPSNSARSTRSRPSGVGTTPVQSTEVQNSSSPDANAALDDDDDMDAIDAEALAEFNKILKTRRIASARHNIAASNARFARTNEEKQPVYGIRQVRSVRGGEFRELSVILGVRFVVGVGAGW